MTVAPFNECTRVGPEERAAAVAVLGLAQRGVLGQQDIGDGRAAEAPGLPTTRPPPNSDAVLRVKVKVIPSTIVSSVKSPPPAPAELLSKVARRRVRCAP